MPAAIGVPTTSSSSKPRPNAASLATLDAASTAAAIDTTTPASANHADHPPARTRAGVPTRYWASVSVIGASA